MLELYFNRLLEIEYIQERLYLFKPIGLQKLIHTAQLNKSSATEEYSSQRILSTVVKIPSQKNVKLEEKLNSLVLSSSSKLAENIISVKEQNEMKSGMGLLPVPEVTSYDQYALESKFSDYPHQNASIYYASNPKYPLGTNFLLKLQYYRSSSQRDLESLRFEYETLCLVCIYGYSH